MTPEMFTASLKHTYEEFQALVAKHIVNPIVSADDELLVNRPMDPERLQIVLEVAAFILYRVCIFAAHNFGIADADILKVVTIGFNRAEAGSNGVSSDVCKSMVVGAVEADEFRHATADLMLAFPNPGALTEPQRAALGRLKEALANGNKVLG